MKALVISCLSIFVCFVAIEYFVGAYSCCYMELWTTFFYDHHYIFEKYFVVGGGACLVADFIVQFFLSPAIANMLMAFLLVAIFAVCYKVVATTQFNIYALIVSAIVPTTLLALTFSSDWLLCGTISMFFCLLCLWLRCKFDKYVSVYDLLCCVSLFLLFGPIAVLYVVSLFIIVKCNLKSLLVALALLIIVLLMSYLTLRSGVVGKWQQILTPMGYFNHHADAPSEVFMPWISVLILVIWRRLKSFIAQKKLLSTTISVFLLVITSAITVNRFVKHEEQLFKKFSYLSCNAEWTKIIDECGGRPSRNVLVQNCVNQAWAHIGELGNHLLDNPQSNMAMLISASIPNGYVAAQIGDIYYSMGHIAMARRYAFEANEHIGGFSPRLLQRLTLIAIIMGEYAEAEKYLNYLDCTIFYSKWAQKYKQLLSDEAINKEAELLQMRKCLIKHNHFCAEDGLVADLISIMRSNTEQKVTAQYLAAIAMFLGEQADYAPLIDEMQANGALPKKLPKYFEQVYKMTKQK